MYGYQQGVGSARALEKMMGYEPGLRWLCAGHDINHHTLSDFRVSHREALDGLLSELLAVLEQEGLADFTTVMQDGTKIRSVASKRSFQRRGRVEEQRQRAREYVKKVAAQSEEENEPGRRQAARGRAAREKQERLEAALEQIQGWEEKASRGRRPRRVSTTEAEARVMKQPAGAAGRRATTCRSPASHGTALSAG